MKPLTRHKVNKHKAAGKFKHQVQHTKAANLNVTPMRGGWRL